MLLVLLAAFAHQIRFSACSCSHAGPQPGQPPSRFEPNPTAANDRRGRGSNGQLADGLATPPVSWPTPTTSTFVGAVSIHAGGHSTCIVNGLGQRLCAGTNQFGQLAIASPPTSVTNTSPVPTAPAGTSFAAPPAFVTVSAGSAPVCTLMLSVKVDATCDPSPPVFSPPLENIAADATSADGAVVSFSPTAEDEGVPVDVTCAPPSDSVFPLGDTTVTCTAGVTTGTFVVRGEGWGKEASTLVRIVAC
jgi:hypothetical protein